MGVGLVSDVPDDAVVGGVEDVVERDGELDHAEAGTQMAAGDGDGVDHLGAHRVGDRLQAALGQVAQSRRLLQTVKDRRHALVLGQGELFRS
ncbi:hypothetical protein BHAOGJBA_6283 [Methylobacterium hispanicum]|uniref:Uncharacterized protein n=1 Tax=Methylobacterium hispanicum TaxID=270350 RepID=A0AAV4ZZA0_9HYPH|nr:hypothetical protein BHAOGJBA_6283 [Methylobacterium hispanicum]